MAIHTGTCIGRYQIHSLLGTGGIGEVYLAKLTERETPDIEAPTLVNTDVYLTFTLASLVSNAFPASRPYRWVLPIMLAHHLRND